MAAGELNQEIECGPVRLIPGDAARPELQHGTALCLSGGGYRAMVFHLGGLIRLNEAGMLLPLRRISSVSGGSITAGVLGLNWKRLNFVEGVATNLNEMLIQPIRRMAMRTIDALAILGGALLPGTIGEHVEKRYRKYLFGDATLQDLPDEPRFVINATNVQSLVLWRFSKPYMGDYRVGLIEKPTVPLARAVAASSAFPPVLSPVMLDVSPGQFRPASGLDLQKEPYTDEVMLTDGGVYDNLGLETVWKQYDTVYVSDGGLKTPPEPEPKRDWPRHLKRVLEVIDNQVRSLRLRQTMEAFMNDNEPHTGAYWGIRTDIREYRVHDALECDPVRAAELAHVPTRLKAMPAELIDRLINWGYALCDAALRGPGKVLITKSPAFPYPEARI